MRMAPARQKRARLPREEEQVLGCVAHAEVEELVEIVRTEKSAKKPAKAAAAQ